MVDPLAEPTAPTTATLALRPKEAAAALGISERTLWSLTASGEIPVVHIHRAKLYPTELLRTWLREHATGGEAK